MASAQIRIDQAANPSPTGIVGHARIDIVRGAAVTLRNGDVTGVTRYSWALLDRPWGSSATMVNPTSAVATVTPDKHGAYRVRLVVNAGGPGEIHELCFYCLDPAGISAPAAGERAPANNYAITPGVYNDKGFARMMNERQLRSLDNRDAPTQLTVGAGSFELVEYDWGLPAALVESIELITDTCTNAGLFLFADAGLTILLHSWLGVNPTIGWQMFNPVFISGLFGTALEDNKVRVLLFNADAADSLFDVYIRMRAP